VNILRRFAKREPKLTIPETVEFLVAAHRHAVRRGDNFSMLCAATAADNLVALGHREVAKL